MDAQTCLKKLEYVGVLSFATVSLDGTPQIRCISAIHYEPDALYFFTARGKEFCKELLHDGRVQILAYTRYKEMIRVSAKAVPVSEAEQKQYIDLIFEEQPTLPIFIPVIQGVSASCLRCGIWKLSISALASIRFSVRHTGLGVV